MRIDKFLWCIRAFKTRTVAAGQARLGKVWVNNELVKASREVKPGDTVCVRKGPVQFSFLIKALPTSRVGAKLVETYASDVTPTEERERMERIRLQNQIDRPKGLGRPSKRERRLLDDFFDLEADDLGAV
ncbi:MAG: RNA-binding S4 domain-containing protein [Crocinitomicaceae bacterium]|nr:RNA-binding S4 domain-containing protein [Crocinitomicaceae bacterium]